MNSFMNLLVFHLLTFGITFFCVKSFEVTCLNWCKKMTVWHPKDLKIFPFFILIVLIPLYEAYFVTEDALFRL